MYLLSCTFRVKWGCSYLMPSKILSLTCQYFKALHDCSKVAWRLIVCHDRPCPIHIYVVQDQKWPDDCQWKSIILPTSSDKKYYHAPKDDQWRIWYWRGIHSCLWSYHSRKKSSYVGDPQDSTNIHLYWPTNKVGYRNPCEVIWQYIEEGLVEQMMYAELRHNIQVNNKVLNDADVFCMSCKLKMNFKS